VAELARSALQQLGLLPTYTCDTPRGTFVGQAADGFRAEHACAAVQVHAQGSTADVLTLTFPSEGCDVHWVTLAGQAVFTYAGSEDGMAVEADVRDLAVNAQALGATATYEECGDDRLYGATGEGDVPGQPGWTHEFEAFVRVHGTAPVLGATSFVIDGHGTLTSADGSTHLTFAGVEYRVGELLPSAGEIILRTASGHTVRVAFSSGFLVGEAELTIDDHAPVHVPLLCPSRAAGPLDLHVRWGHLPPAWSGAPSPTAA
jgi:hypothetical protein